MLLRFGIRNLVNQSFIITVDASNSRKNTIKSLSLICPMINIQLVRLCLSKESVRYAR